VTTPPELEQSQVTIFKNKKKEPEKMKRVEFSLAGIKEQ
jgi:hypothetical protein